MILIPDNNTLRQFIPNAFAAAADMPSLFDKIEPFLHQAEIWFCDNFIPYTMLQGIVDATESQHNPLYFLPRRIVTARAFRQAVPTLDVLITQNGIGAAETNNLKPAAKAKIDRLIEGLFGIEDESIRALIPRLFETEAWRRTPQAKNMAKTLFPDFAAVDTAGYTGDLWQAHILVTSRVREIEDRAGRLWLSEGVLEDLRRHQLTGMGDPRHAKMQRLRDLVRQYVLSELRGDSTVGGQLHPDIERAVNLIRSDMDYFCGYRGSEADRLWRVKDFENGTDSTGYYL